MDNFTKNDNHPLMIYENKFLSENECASIIHTEKNFLEDALVISESGNKKSKGRNNKTAFLDNSNYNYVTERITKRFKIKDPKYTKIQLLRYTPNEKYHPHYDAYTKTYIENNKQEQRKSTFLIYLSSYGIDFTGGETNFPFLETTIKPTTGSILVFNNCFQDTLHAHPKMLHESKQIKKGIKWALNFWCNSEVDV